MIDPDYQVGAEANYYFMFVSVFMIAILGTWVTEKSLSRAWVNMTPVKPALIWAKIKLIT